MTDHFKDNYFSAVRIVMMLVISVCCIMAKTGMDEIYDPEGTGVSLQVLLFVSLFIGIVSLKEMLNGKMRLLMLFAAAVLLTVLCVTGGMCFLLLLPFLVYEVMSEFPGIPVPFYFVPLFLVFIQNPVGVIPRILMISLLSIIYIQHDRIIREYKKRMMDDMVQEQSLKRDMRETEYAVKAQLRRNVLKTENQILEERAKLSQTLHDKLGHSINGSIYQLEGAKVLMEKDQERSGKMIQAVIDQLRSGMDEIRGILRKERPEKKELAMLELYKLCEDCEDKGVEAEVSVEGDTAQISDTVWEVILDNTYEAVTNSMKYSECQHIDIHIVVMNKMVRCTVKDNGKGCPHFEDGMGISGMRQRVRAANGTIDFATEIGFAVKMLLPLE
jgi:signal transduction histidine kinase